VWDALKNKPLQMVGKVISASPTKLTLAGSADDGDRNMADIDLTMTASIPAKMIPAEGKEIPFEGVPVSYEPKPFMMTMNKGALLSAAAPAAKKPTTPTTRKKPQ